MLTERKSELHSREYYVRRPITVDLVEPEAYEGAILAEDQQIAYIEPTTPPLATGKGDTQVNVYDIITGPYQGYRFYLELGDPRNEAIY